MSALNNTTVFYLQGTYPRISMEITRILEYLTITNSLLSGVLLVVLAAFYSIYPENDYIKITLKYSTIVLAIVVLSAVALQTYHRLFFVTNLVVTNEDGKVIFHSPSAFIEDGNNKYVYYYENRLELRRLGAGTAYTLKIVPYYKKLPNDVDPLFDYMPGYYYLDGNLLGQKIEIDVNVQGKD